MKRLKLMIVLILLFAGGFWAWQTMFPSPEKVIRKQLSELAKVVSIAPNEAPLAQAVNSQKLSTFFTRDVTVQVDVPGRGQVRFSGNDELLQAALTARAQLNGLQVEFLDVSVWLAPDKQAAAANLTGKARVPGERELMVEEFKFGFRKAGRNWLIDQVQTVKTLY
jgi:hypothetical protein